MMSPETVAYQFQASYGVTKANTAGLTHEDSLCQPKPGGNCLNWVLGHMTAARSQMLGAMGAEPVWNETDSKPYDRHAKPITNEKDAKPLEVIFKDLEKSQARILEQLPKLTPEQLAAKAPFSPVGNPNETIGSLLAGFAFHDAYHAGQTGIIRRLVGKEGADL